MEKYIFVYDFLMKDIENKEYGLTDFIGVGCLYDYKRNGYHFAMRTEDKTSCVVGDIFKLDDKLEDTMDRFFGGFGYSKTKEYVTLIPKDEELECVVYYLEDRKEMISEEEMKRFGSAEPFEFMKESYDMTEKEFKRTYIDGKTEIQHILPTSIDGFKKELDIVKEEYPEGKVLVSGFAIVVTE